MKVTENVLITEFESKLFLLVPNLLYGVKKVFWDFVNLLANLKWSGSKPGSLLVAIIILFLSSHRHRQSGKLK